MSDAVTDAPTRSASPPWLWVALIALALLPTAHRFRNRFVWDDVYVIERQSSSARPPENSGHR